MIPHIWKQDILLYKLDREKKSVLYLNYYKMLSLMMSLEQIQKAKHSIKLATIPIKRVQKTKLLL